MRISNTIEIRTSSDHINFFAKNKFCAIFPERKDFGFEVKIPVDEIKESNLKTKWHQCPGSKWSYVHVYESSDLSVLSKLAREAYMRAHK